MFSWYVKSFKLIAKTIGFEGVACCVRELKRRQQAINNYTKLLPQIDETSMHNLSSKM